MLHCTVPGLLWQAHRRWEMDVCDASLSWGGRLAASLSGIATQPCKYPLLITTLLFRPGWHGPILLFNEGLSWFVASVLRREDEPREIECFLPCQRSGQPKTLCSTARPPTMPGRKGLPLGIHFWCSALSIRSVALFGVVLQGFPR